MRRAFAYLRSLFAWVWGSPFEGANYSTKRTQTMHPPQSARFDVTKATRLAIVEKSRDLDKNSALYNQLKSLFELYTVGTGLQVSPTSSNPDWNERARAWFEQWSEFADLTTRQSLGTLESLWADLWFTDGETFILLTHGEPDETRRRRPRVSTFETHLCETPPSMAEFEGSSIMDGIEVDGRGRPVAYWFRQEVGSSIDRAVKHERVAAEFVIHLCEPTRPGEMRPLPFCFPCINDFLDLHEIDCLEMEAAKQAARRTDVIETATGEYTPSTLIRQRMASATAAPAAAPAVGETDTAQVAEKVTGVKPVLLKTGEKFNQYVSQRPSVVTQEYYRTREEKACAGIGIPRVLVFPGSMQGTVYRGALDSANAYFRARFSVIRSAVARVYQYAIKWAIQNEPSLRDAPADWWRVSIAPPRAVNVDVGRNSAAMLNELAAGATDYELIYAPLGLNWRERFQALKEQQDFARGIGLLLPGATATTSAGAGDAGQAAAAAEPLNGAQITAAIDVMVKLREQTLAPLAALELLVGIGIERAKAERIVGETPLGLDNSAGDAAFKREVLKQLLSVPAAREAVYNGVDIEDLIAQTGLSPEKGYEAPYIPVVAASGPLVSGETVKDAEGDVVGGDVEDNGEGRRDNGKRGNREGGDAAAGR